MSTASAAHRSSATKRAASAASMSAKLPASDAVTSTVLWLQCLRCVRALWPSLTPLRRLLRELWPPELLLLALLIGVPGMLISRPRSSASNASGCTCTSGPSS